MPEPKFEKGVWVCPICGFKAMSKKVVTTHMEREHPEAFQKEEKNVEKSKNNTKKPQKNESQKKKEKGGITKRSFKLSKTEIRLWDYEHIDIKDQRSWQMFLNRNYISSLHRQRVKVKLVTGDELEGLLKARDPYFIAIVLENGERVYINKAHVVWVKPVREDE